MGCCGGRGCNESSDTLGAAGSSTAKVHAGVQRRPAAGGSSVADPVELRGACQTAGTPAASSRNVPYGGPGTPGASTCNAPYGGADDEQCEGTRVTIIEDEPERTAPRGGGAPPVPERAAPSGGGTPPVPVPEHAAPCGGGTLPVLVPGGSPSASPSARRALSLAGTREASPRAPDWAAGSSPRSSAGTSAESIAVLEVTSLCQSPPRKLLCSPEQGGAMLPLPPTSRPPASTAAKPSPAAGMSGAATKTRAPQPPAVVPEKKTLLARVRALPGALARQRVFAPAALRRSGGPRAKDAKPCSRPVVAPVAPRKVARPVRPARPVPPGAAPRSAAAPQAAQVQAASVVTARNAHPQQMPLRVGHPPREPSPRPPVGRTVGSRRGSTSAEGTSPGHSPSPEHSPVQRAIAPVRRCEPSPAAHQEQEMCCGDEEDDVEYVTPQSRRGDSPDFHSGPEGHRTMVPGADIHGYTIQCPLGKGAFGAVWLATSRRAGAVAMKVSRSGDYRIEGAAEIQVLEAIDAFARSTRKKDLKPYRERMVALRCSFELSGRAGARHQVAVLEALGPNLDQFAAHHSGRCVAPQIVKAIMRQLLQALEFLAEMGMCHADLKLDNIVLSAQCLRPSGTASSKGRARAADLLQGKHRRLRGESQAHSLIRNYAIKLIDFGKAFRCREVRLASPIQTLPYRAPEVVCGARAVSPAADMWSAGCICAELLAGGCLFDVNERIINGLQSNLQIWAVWVETIGQPPPTFYRPEKYEFVHLYIDDLGKLVEHLQTHSRPLLQRLQGSATADCPRLSSMIDFVLHMLKYCPEERVRPQDARRHPWLHL